jgi:hypothetical protein
MAKKEYLLMPEESHGTGETAATQVTLLFQRNNCAVDKIKADYGEDLLIQPSVKSQVEHFKMWVQVKGTSDIEKYRQRSGNVVRSISFAHMFKWLRSKELCVLLLWDTEKEYGLYYLPKDELDEWEFYTERADNIQVIFDEQNRFTKDTVPQLLWRARYAHYAMLLAHADVRMRCALDENSGQQAHAMFLSVAIDFLLQVEIIRRRPNVHDDDVAEEDVRDAGHWLELCPKFRARVGTGVVNMQDKYPRDSASSSFEYAIALTLLVTLEENSQTVGVPPELIELSVPVLVGLQLLI